jgi:acetyltransferase-like isoleucine patch superfamily enzyme
MVYSLFKILRKLKLFFSQICIKIKILEYSCLSHRRFQIKPPLNIGKRFLISSDITQSRILIKQNCRIRDGFHIYIGNNGFLSVGENCFFNSNCSINCLSKIEIGNDNQFGENVLLYDHNHQFSENNRLISEQGYNLGNIRIGNNCWIGSNVVILKDVIIGDNVVIGAGCIIHKSIPSNSLVVNNQNLLMKRGDIH